MFAMLPPGGKLGAHRDPFAGSLRYHLGLVTPNSEKCRILVDGVRMRLARRRGLHVRRDFHSQRGECDRRQPHHPVLRRRTSDEVGFMTAINRWVSHHIVKASATQNVDGEHVGVLNKVFGKLYEIHLASRTRQGVEPQGLLRAEIQPDDRHRCVDRGVGIAVIARHLASSPHEPPGRAKRADDERIALAP
jgi:aspartyl/asparaginyl beta-hydroxylase (cupin superfamily)